VRPAGGKRLVFRSLDGGRTWTRIPKPASVFTEAGIGAAGPDGTIYFDYPQYYGLDPDSKRSDVYPYAPADDCRMAVAVSEDRGDTWRHAIVPDSLNCNAVYGQQRVAVDSAGTVYAVWTDDRDQQAYLARSTDKGRNWAPRIKVTTPEASMSSIHINVTAREPGHVAISYQATAGTTAPYKGIAPNQVPLNAYLSESFDASSPVPTFETAALNRTGDPLIKGAESATEGTAYVTFDGNGRPWAVHVRHAPSLWTAGDVVVGTLRRHPEGE
jgi:hypothetical protein